MQFGGYGFAPLFKCRFSPPHPFAQAEREQQEAAAAAAAARAQREAEDAEKALPSVCPLFELIQ